MNHRVRTGVGVGDAFPRWAAHAVCGIEDTDVVDVSSDTFDGLWRLIVVVAGRGEHAIDALVSLKDASRSLETMRCVVVAAVDGDAPDLLAWRRAEARIASAPYPMIDRRALAHAVDASSVGSIVFAIDRTGIVRGRYDRQPIERVIDAIRALT